MKTTFIMQVYLSVHQYYANENKRWKLSPTTSANSGKKPISAYTLKRIESTSICPECDYNECLIMNVLAAVYPTNRMDFIVYHQRWGTRRKHRSAS